MDRKIVAFQFADGRLERFGTTAAIWDFLTEDVEGSGGWAYVPFDDGGALVSTVGLQWVSVYSDADDTAVLSDTRG